jgi:hypothetical protein
MKITTFHKRVWKINSTEVLPVEKVESTKTRRIARYEVESDYVGVVYSETESFFKLHVGYKVDAEKTIPNIIGLAVKLEVKKILLEHCELLKHLKIWDHHTQVVNKMLEKTIDS